MTQQGFAESDSLSNIYTTGELSTRVTESPPQTQQGFAEPPQITMYSTQAQWMTAESDSQRHSSRTQLKKIAEAGSPHTAQRLSRRRWLSLALHTHTAQRLSGRRWLNLALHTHSSETQRKKMDESGFPHRTLPGPWTECRTGLSLASQRDI